MIEEVILIRFYQV